LIFSAFCRNLADNKWYTFDDTKVSEMPEEEVVTRAAYLLFYQRRTTRQHNVTDPCHWMHMLPRLQMKGSKFKHSKSHEDLLDGKMMSLVRFGALCSFRHEHSRQCQQETELTFL
jgi:hypothetical protein